MSSPTAAPPKEEAVSSTADPPQAVTVGAVVSDSDGEGGATPLRRRRASSVSFGGSQGNMSPASVVSPRSQSSPKVSIPGSGPAPTSPGPRKSSRNFGAFRKDRKNFYLGLTKALPPKEKIPDPSPSDDVGFAPIANGGLGGGLGGGLDPNALVDSAAAAAEDDAAKNVAAALEIPAIRCPQLGSAAVALSYLLHQQQRSTLLKSPLDASLTVPPDVPADHRLRDNLQVTVELLFSTLQLPLSYATNASLSINELVDVLKRFVAADTRFQGAEVDFCTLDVQRLESGADNAAMDSQARQFACTLSDFRTELQLDAQTRNKVKVLCYDPTYVDHALNQLNDNEEEEDGGEMMMMLASFVSPSIRAEKKQANELSSTGPKQTTQTACVIDIHPGTQMVELATPYLATNSVHYGIEVLDAPLHMVHRGMTAPGPEGRAQGFISIKMPGQGLNESINTGTKPTTPPVVAPKSPVNAKSPTEGLLPPVPDSADLSLSNVEQAMKDCQPKHKPTPVLDLEPLMLSEISSGVASHLVAVGYALHLMAHATPVTPARAPAILDVVETAAKKEVSVASVDPTTVTPIGASGSLDLGSITRTLQMPAEHLFRSTMRVDQVAAYLRAYVKKAKLGYRVAMMPLLKKRKTKGAPVSVSISQLGEMLERISELNRTGKFTPPKKDTDEHRPAVDEEVVPVKWMGVGDDASSKSTNGGSTPRGESSNPRGESSNPRGESSNIKDQSSQELANNGKAKAVLLICHDSNIAHSTLNITTDGPHWCIFNGFSDISHAVLCYDTEPSKYGRSYYVPLEDLHTAMVNGGFVLLTSSEVNMTGLLPELSDATVAAFVEEQHEKPYVPHLFLKNQINYPTRQKAPLILAAQALSTLGYATTMTDLIQHTPCADPTQLLANDFSINDYAGVVNSYLSQHKDAKGISATVVSASQSQSRLASVSFLATINQALEQKQQIIVNFSRGMVLSAPPMPEYALCNTSGGFVLVVGYAETESTLLVHDSNPDPSHRQWTVSAIDLFKASQDVCLLSRRHRGLIIIGPEDVKDKDAPSSASVSAMYRAVCGGKGYHSLLVPKVNPFTPTIFPLATALSMVSNSLGQVLSPDEGLHRAFSGVHPKLSNGCLSPQESLSTQEMLTPSPTDAEADGAPLPLSSVLSAGRRKFDMASILEVASKFLDSKAKNSGSWDFAVVPALTREVLQDSTKSNEKEDEKGATRKRLLLVYDVREVHHAAHSYTGLAVIHPASPAATSGSDDNVVYCVDAEPSSWGRVWASTTKELLPAVLGVLVVSHKKE